MEQYTNDLIRESSPYLKQHAHNPVNWVAWSDDIFRRAQEEDKLVLVSVGYSSCHWCHVMEHECFEDEEVAALMNKFFINVKVDREERPDVDMVYMTAVQLMTQRGGWPLNCVTLPDGRPVYGGTYFPKEQWMHILRSLQHVFTNERERMEQYAGELISGVKSSEVIAAPAENSAFTEAHLDELIRRWAAGFDREFGGTSRAPKFPLPNNLNFLLEYAVLSGNETVRAHVERTLDAMAMGGIYDQIGGGFARYSVDMLWKVPHFEKMTYDNGQLLSAYAAGYRHFRKEMYREVILETVAWLEREMSDPSGAFYSALDADSEGEEGRYYIWTESELRQVLEEDEEWVKQYYCVDQRGLWEDGHYILLRRESDEDFAGRMGWTVKELNARLNRVKTRLLEVREKRERPGLDTKCLTSWNAMVMQGLCETYAVLNDPDLLVPARRIAHWIRSRQRRPDGGLWRNYMEGKSSIEGFLEDYAHVISAFIAMYQVTGEEALLEEAREWCDMAISRFGDSASGMFYFTRADSGLIARKMELSDNVIPASNSVMARNLYYLGHYFHLTEYEQRARQMLANVYDGMEMYGSGYSNWGMLLLHELYGLHDVVVVGDPSRILQQWFELPLPGVLLAVADTPGKLPVFEGKAGTEKGSTIYVCTAGTCYAPAYNVTDASRYVIQ